MTYKIFHSFFTIVFVAVIFGTGSQAGILGLTLACLMVSIIALFIAKSGNRPVRQILAFWGLIFFGYFLNLLLPSVPILLEANKGMDILNQEFSWAIFK